jgi:hypothetical protein
VRRILRAGALALLLLLVILPAGEAWLRHRQAEARPVEAGACATYGIVFDGSSIEALYLEPERTLQAGSDYVAQNRALALLAARQHELGEPSLSSQWETELVRIAALPAEQRRQEVPFQLYERIAADRDRFCAEAVPRILSFLP